MNKVMEQLQAPGSNTYRMVIKRDDVEAEEVNHQIEFMLDFGDEP